MLKLEPTSFGSDYATALTLSSDFFRERTRHDPENFIVGAFAADELIGSCGGLRESSAKRRHIGTIWGMYLQAAHRGKGIAQQLLQAAVDALSQLDGLEQIQLAVTAGNAAGERLYRSAGFIEYGREPGALKVDGENYDELLMYLPLR